MIDLAKVALGRTAHDSARFLLADSHVLGAVTPVMLDRSELDFTPGLYGNDVLPICTAVALANCARAASFVYCNCDIVLDPANPRAFFARVMKVANTDAAIEATGGAQVQDILDAATATGYDVGQQVPLVPVAAAIHGMDQAHIMDAVFRYGAANLGVALSMSDQTMQTWDTVAPPDAGDPTPGSWGLHDLFIWDWNGTSPTSTVRLGTWGYWQRATWRWVLARIIGQEAWAIRWPQLEPAASA